MRELMERLRMTEHQLITVKSSWAESEQEREQMITQIQEQDDSICALKEQVLSQKISIAALTEKATN